jgi:hypothetical protein
MKARKTKRMISPAFRRIFENMLALSNSEDVELLLGKRKCSDTRLMCALMQQGLMQLVNDSYVPTDVGLREFDKHFKDIFGYKL